MRAHREHALIHLFFTFHHLLNKVLSRLCRVTARVDHVGRREDSADPDGFHVAGHNEVVLDTQVNGVLLFEDALVWQVYRVLFIIHFVLLLIRQFLRFCLAARLDLQELIFDRLLAHIEGRELVEIVAVDPAGRNLFLREKPAFHLLEQFLVNRSYFGRYLLRMLGRCFINFNAMQSILDILNLCIQIRNEYFCVFGLGRVGDRCLRHSAVHFKFVTCKKRL